MKIITNILKVIVMMLLTVCLGVVTIKNVITSTILNKQYVLQKLDETNFYSEMHKIVETNFENYINQSGLDEEVLNNICTQEKVKKDINIIISNIYDGTNEEIDTTEISEKLNFNIDEQNVRTSQNNSAIDEFVKHICESYKDSIINTKYENVLNGTYKKIFKALEKIEQIIIIILIVSIIFLVILNIKNISKVIANFATILFSTSLLQFVFTVAIKSKVNIKDIKAFNEVFSTTIVTIIENILNQINKFGIIILIFSVLFIIIYEIIIYYKNSRNEKIKNRKGRKWKN